MEIMRIRIFIYVCALMSLDVQTNTASVKDSSEQSALQEALLLVELLKSEYSKVLKEKTPIKKKEIDEKDLQTCATTTASTDDVTHTATDIPLQHIEQSSKAETLKHYNAHDSRRSYLGYRADISPQRDRPSQAFQYYDFPRRRFINYPDYYGNYGRARQWRRRDYENVFGPRPGMTIPPSTVSQSTTASATNSHTDTTLSSISTNAFTTIVSEMSTSSILSHTSSSSATYLSSTSSSTTPKSVTLSVKTLKPAKYQLSSTLPTLITVLNIKQPSLILKRAFSLPSAVNKKTQTKNHSVSEKVKQNKPYVSVKKTTFKSTYEPEQAQVAAELENELEGAIEGSTSLSSSSSHRHPVSWRPSTRVHMARSTPYRIPLPENHAFCFTNPENSLCRTFIK